MNGVGKPEWIVPVTLVFVSMLTLPHMFVVERLWKLDRPVGEVESSVQPAP